MFVLSHREEGDGWVEEEKLEGHSDWVRDVAWAPSIGLPRNIIASCSQVSFAKIKNRCLGGKQKKNHFILIFHLTVSVKNSELIIIRMVLV